MLLGHRWNRATFLVINFYHPQASDTLFNKLNLPTLFSRRRASKLIFFLTYPQSRGPPFLSPCPSTSFLLSSSLHTPLYLLNFTRILAARTESYNNSFFPCKHFIRLCLDVHGTTSLPISNLDHQLESLNTICPDLKYDLLSYLLHYLWCSKH